MTDRGPRYAQTACWCAVERKSVPVNCKELGLGENFHVILIFLTLPGWFCNWTSISYAKQWNGSKRKLVKRLFAAR